MKRIITVLLILFVSIGTASAQEFVEDVQAAYEAFAEDLAPAVPSAAVLGSTWSDAYIGQFPRFGAGVYAGAALLPLESFESLLTVVDPSASLPAEITNLAGVPLPVFGLDARLGGLILPFDVGVKAGVIPETFQINANTSINYMSFGVDLRYPLLKGNIILPKLSVGLGYNYLSSSVTMTGILDNGPYVLVDNGGSGANIEVTSPDFGMSYTSSVIDLRLQASKKFLFITPYAGLGASWASSKIGGSLSSEIQDDLGNPLDQAGIDSRLSSAGISGLTINPAGFVSENAVNAFTYRAYVGASVGLLIFKVDLGASYNFNTQNLAGQVGVRVQF